MFARGSRYEQVADGLYIDRNKRQIPYKLMRVIPTEFITQQMHRVGDGERLDQISFRYFADPLQFWRICDANRASEPEELERTGTRLAIPIVQR